MSRPSSMGQRPLTLTEELEKLEQSITLTLQEIDHNFSQAHRIVTTSILPVVEQYAEHSRDVWEGAKFWKQFFEASANVSLSGYEERPNEDTVQDETATEEDPSYNTSESQDTSYDAPTDEHAHRDDHDIDLTNLTLSSHSTPRPGQQQQHHDPDDLTITPSIEDSPYETLKQEINETNAPFDLEEDSSTLPTTPGKHNAYDSIMSSPFVPPVSHSKPSSSKPGRGQNHPSDPVLHRLHDKTYRVQATPLGKSGGYGHYAGGYGTSATRPKFTVTPKQAPSSSHRAYDDSPPSSPELEAPKLHAEIFSSPLKAQTPRTARKPRTSSHLRVTPRPGMSVLTPAKGGTGKRPSAWDSDDDDNDGDDMVYDFDDEDLGPSPPKTMQFHIPQSRLMKTPAKEASKRIVADLLTTAGADTTEDIVEDASPSIIRRAERLEDESF